MVHLINSLGYFFEFGLLKAYVHSDDVKIIQSIPVNRVSHPDTYCWLFTIPGRYIVKSGYDIERSYPDNESTIEVYGPNIKPFSEYTLKLKCLPKLKYCLQTISRSLPVTNNLKTRRIQCDTRCNICGADEKSINHIFLKIPSAIQTWSLSKTPSNPIFFSNHIIFLRI